MLKIEGKTMLKRIIVTALIITIVELTSAVPAFAWSNSTRDNPAYWPDRSYMYNDIWLGSGMSFGVSGSTWFVPSGTKKNTSIYNKTSVSITGVGVSIYGLSVNPNSHTTYSTLTNTLGQNWAGISGTVSTDQWWYAYMTGTSSGSVWYDSSPRTSAASVTKWS